MYWSLPQKGWDTSSKKKDVKGVDGKGCLTNAKIDTLQNYFDIALCQNVGDIDKMISACKASVFDVAQLSKKSKFIPVPT